MATFEKRGDAYLVRVFLGRDGKGKRMFHNKTIRGNKKVAKAYADRIERERDLGTFIERSNTTFNEHCDKWIDRQRKLDAPSPRTLMDYEKHLARYARPLIGDRLLCQVTPADIDGIYMKMAERGCVAAMRITRAALRGAFEYAVEMRILARNPAKEVRLPKAKGKRQELKIKALDVEQAKRLLVAAALDRYGLAFVVALETGMRPGEYLALQWKDIDFTNGIVRVQRSLSRGPDGWYFHDPKTAKSRRTLPLSRSLLHDLECHRLQQQDERRQAGQSYEDLDLVFATANGTPINDRNLNQRHFKPLLKAAGLPMSTRVYDLRHSCASILLQAKEHIKVVVARRLICDRFAA